MLSWRIHTAWSEGALCASGQDNKLSDGRRLAAGFAAGITEALIIVTPFEVVKIRLQQQHGGDKALLKYKVHIHERWHFVARLQQLSLASLKSGACCMRPAAGRRGPESRPGCACIALASVTSSVPVGCICHACDAGVPACGCRHCDTCRCGTEPGMAARCAAESS